MHFRGPIELYKFAVYYPNTSSRRKRTEEHIKRHAHGHHHKRDGAHVTTTTKTITSTIYIDPETATSALGGVATSTPSVTAPSSNDDDDDDVVGDYKRTGYYDADAGTADGLVFLGQKGGQGSGVFDK